MSDHLVIMNKLEKEKRGFEKLDFLTAFICCNWICCLSIQQNVNLFFETKISIDVNLRMEAVKSESL